MICKHCNNWNEDEAKFCCRCGSQLHRKAVVSTPVSISVTATGIPTSGVRFFQNMGNPYLQKAANIIRNSEIQQTGIYQNYTTHAKTHPLNNGDWFCPDCGELNSHNKTSCKGCGRYK